MGLFLYFYFMKTQALHALFLECDKISTDTRKISKNDMFFALKGEHFNGNTFANQALEQGAKYVIVDEAKYQTSNAIILVDNVLKALQDLASFHRSYLNIPIIALTGSNGKTTTKELINATLSQQYQTTATVGNLNNHIGVPLTLLSMTKATQIGIVEMGANHLEEIAFLCRIAKPDYGYITNFGKAHLEGFGSIEGVITGKTELYNYLEAHNKLVFINSNDPIQVAKSTSITSYSFGNASKNQSADLVVNLESTSPFITVTCNNTSIQTQLIGAYNFNNIAAAICIATYFKVSDSNIKKGLENYVPANNRSQIITKNKTQIILDAYNANPTSMTAALTNFSGLQVENKIVILGDMFELGKEAETEHNNIAHLATNLEIDQALLIGEHFYKTEIDSKKIKRYRSFEDFKNEFDFKALQNATLLIKGSRGMALERILNLI